MSLDSIISAEGMDILTPDNVRVFIGDELLIFPEPIREGVVMYFMGMFDPAPIIVKVESNVTKETKDKVSIVKYKTLKKVDFKVSDINTNRLNIKLEALTKYEILSDKELKTYTTAEKKRLLELDKETKLLAFSKLKKEEPLVIKKENPKVTVIEKTIITNKEEIQKKLVKTEPVIKVEAIKKEIIIEDKKLKFILANRLKYKFFTTLVSETNTKKARVFLCNNAEGRSIIYIGPFESEQLQIEMKTLISEQNQNIKTTILNITEDEFNVRCPL